MKPCIGLIVPALELGGGVPSVAAFLRDLALRYGGYRLCVISLASSSRDEASVRLVWPTGWRRGIRTRHSHWQGTPFVHIGATIGELEFQRYRPRKSLTDAVAGCDILQVVCGSPAPAYAVCHLRKPVSLQCATRAKIERRRCGADPWRLAVFCRRVMTQITDVIEGRTLRLVDAVQVENAWMYDHVRRINKGREVDVRFAPPGVDVRTFYPATERDIRRKPYVLCVGRLSDPRKNIGLLLEAFAMLPRGVRSQLRLVLAGSASPPEEFWNRAATLGMQDRIRFVDSPSTAKLVKLYQQASMFVLPSDEEGFGLVLVEAMSCGIPVVSTRSGGPEGIITDGEDGYLIPRDDAVALSNRILRLYSHSTLNHMMGSRARNTVESRYSQDVAGKAYLEVWENLLSKSKS